MCGLLECVAGVGVCPFYSVVAGSCLLVPVPSMGGVAGSSPLVPVPSIGGVAGSSPLVPATFIGWWLVAVCSCWVLPLPWGCGW